MEDKPYVRIVKLEPFRVASCRAVSEHPELDAFETIDRWAQTDAEPDSTVSQFFGFDNPPPTSEGKSYGYEVWMTVGPEAESGEGVQIKDFSGGLFAVTRTRLTNISRAWKELVDWCQTSSYHDADGPCLEEHLSLPHKVPLESVLVDIYLPIEQ